MPAQVTEFFTNWTSLAILAKLGWILQIALIVHVIKTGRPYWWCLILFMVPGIGVIVYLIVEILPCLRLQGPSASWKPRAWRIKDLCLQFEEADTIKTRFALADALAGAGQAKEACDLAEAGLSGVFRDDPHTLATVARFRLEAGKPAEALEALDRVDTRRDRMLEADVNLLRGRALVLTGHQPEAQAALEALKGRHIGEEARYFLALSL